MSDPCCVIIGAMIQRHRLLIAAPLLMSLACNREAAAPATPPSTAAPTPPPTPSVPVLVTNEAPAALTVSDAANGNVSATAPLGKRPRGIQAGPGGKFLYVALSGSPNAGPGVDEKTLPPPDRTADGIGVVDLAQGKLLKVLTSGADPETVAVSPDGAHVYVANEDTAKASVVDVNSGQIVESFKIGEEPEGTAVEPHNGRLWVTS